MEIVLISGFGGLFLGILIALAASVTVMDIYNKLIMKEILRYMTKLDVSILKKRQPRQKGKAG